MSTLLPAEARHRGLSASTLKILACVCMAIDHVGAFILPHMTFLRVVGRLAFPIFAYFIAEGCHYTRNRLKRFLLVFGLGLLCEAAYFLFEGELEGNILLTFSFSILMIYGMQACKKALAQKKWLWAGLWLLVFLGTVAVTYWFSADVVHLNYGFYGAMLPVFTAVVDYKEGEAPAFLRFFHRRGWKLACFAAGLLLLCRNAGFRSLQTYCLLSILPLAFYNGQVGVKRFKYAFYIFYPAHLIVIWLVSLLILWLSARYS